MSKPYPEKMLDLDKSTFRLKLPTKSTFKVDDTNIAMIHEVNGQYNIAFTESSVYQKTNDHGVIGKTPVDNKDRGFFFDITEEDGAFRIKNSGLCLSIRSYDKKTTGHYVNGMPCRIGAPEQLFYIKAAPLEATEAPEREKSDHESEDPLRCILDRNPPHKKDVYRVFYHTPTVPIKNMPYFEDMYPSRSFIDPASKRYQDEMRCGHLELGELHRYMDKHR